MPSSIKISKTGVDGGGWMDTPYTTMTSRAPVDPMENNHIAVILDGKYVSKTQNSNIVPEQIIL